MQGSGCSHMRHRFYHEFLHHFACLTRLAFLGNPILQAKAKIGILPGSFAAGLLGDAVLLSGARHRQFRGLIAHGSRPFAGTPRWAASCTNVPAG